MVVIKRFFISFLLIFNFSPVIAQIVSDVSASQINNKIIVKYTLNCSEPCNIKLEVRNIKGFENDVFYGGVWYLPENTSGDIGKVYSGEHLITWDVLKEFNEFVYNDIRFRITAEPIFGNKYDFVNIGFVPNSYNDLNNLSIQFGSQSYFISAKFCVSSLSKSNYNCDLNSVLNFNSITDNINFNNTYKVERFSILFGKSFKFKKNNKLKPMLAIGYGSYVALWGYNIFNASSFTFKSDGYAKNVNLSTEGFESQIGFKYNYYKFNFITSFNLVFSSEKTYYDCNFGIGYNLIKKKL
jgi:hypothetical protein